MTKTKEGVVIKVISNRYTIRCEGRDYIAHARGKIKRDDTLLAGDYVAFHLETPFAVIDRILPRKNALTRPYVANVDVVLIVIAPLPEPDFLLVDKIILNAHREGITPILCLNKTDLLTEEDVERLFLSYRHLYPCVAISAKSGAGLEQIAPIVAGKTIALAGQSAVGKSSLMNAILDASIKTDGLSKRVNRGKNTTRHVELFEALDGRMIDTCGFSMLELPNIRQDELKFYYDDYLAASESCKHRRCDHINEPDCGVKEGVSQGTLDNNRYLRYTLLYQELKENWAKKNGN